MLKILFPLALLVSTLGAQSSFTSGGAIVVSNTIKASPYPTAGSCTANNACVDVTGLTGTITNVSVTLTNVTLTGTANVAILLESPGGGKLDILSNACRGSGTQTFTLTDQAATPAAPGPATNCITTGNWKPTNNHFTGFSADNFPSPGPGTTGYTRSDPDSNATGVTTVNTGTFGNVFAVSSVNATPNGTWKLWVTNQASSGVTGQIGSWTVTVTTSTPTSPSNYCAPASSSTTTYTCTVTGLTTYYAGLVVPIKPDVTNTASSTVNITSLGAKTLQKLSSGALANLASGDFVAGVVYLARYNGSVFVVDPGVGGSSSGYTYCAPASASTTTYTCSPSTALTSYTAGTPVIFTPDVTNSASSTVNVSSLGAKTLKKLVGGAISNLTSGDLVAGVPYTLIYDGTYFVVNAINPPTGYNLSDFSIVKTSSTVITVNPSASVSSPIPMRCGSTISKITAPGTITLSSGTASVSGYLYIDCSSTSPVLTFGHNSANTYTGSGVTIATSITGFPSTAVSAPLWAVTGTSGVWDAVSASNDNRSIFGGSKGVTAGSNITVTETAAGWQVAATGGSFVSGILNRQGPLTNVTMTGGGTYDTLFTYTLPANTLGANGCIRVIFNGTSSGAITLRFSWGSKNYDNSLGGATTNFRSEFEICNNGATNTQSTLWPNVAGAWYANNSDAAPLAGYDTSTQDTTSTVVIALKATGTNPETVTPLAWKVVQQ